MYLGEWPLLFLPNKYDGMSVIKLLLLAAGNMECFQRQSLDNLESDSKHTDQVHGGQWVFCCMALHPMDTRAVISKEGNSLVHQMSNDAFDDMKKEMIMLPYSGQS